MTSSTARRGALDQVARICVADLEERQLRMRVLAELHKAIGFDHYMWLLTDPRTAVGSSPLAAVPFLSDLPHLIKLRYLTDVNRWTTLASRKPPVGLLHEEAGGDGDHSLAWRAMLRTAGIGDVATVVFADRFGCWGFLDLWRDAAASAFDGVDRDVLTSMSMPVTRALRAGLAHTFAMPPSRDPTSNGPMVLLLDNELRVQNQTEATEPWLRVLLPAPEGARAIPAAAYNVAAQLLAVEHGVDSNPPSARVHLADGLWVTLRAARLGPDSIAVTIEETAAADRLDLFARCFGLSTRESELLGHLATGSDTRDLARRLFVSENTVQDHLKSIFSKTSARNRRTLLSRALGTRPA